jgi:hypothetical protein
MYTSTRVAERSEADAPVEVQEDSGLLESGHPGLHRVPGEPEGVRKADVGTVRIGAQGTEELEVDFVETVHTA